MKRLLETRHNNTGEERGFFSLKFYTNMFHLEHGNLNAEILNIPIKILLN